MSSDREEGPRIFKAPPLTSERLRIPAPALGRSPVRSAAELTKAERAALSPEDLAALTQPDPAEELRKARAEAEILRSKVQKNAEDLLWKARQEAQTLREQAQQEAQVLRQQAWDAGHQAGEQASREAMQASLEKVQALLIEAQAERERLLLNAEGEVVRLTLELARRLLRLEPLLNEQVIAEVAKDALQRLGEPGEVTICVHPADVEILQLALSQMREVHLLLAIEADDSLSPGGCLIRSRNGTIDARLDAQFERIAQSFLAVMPPEENFNV